MAVGIHVDRVRSVEVDDENQTVIVKLKSNGDSVALYMDESVFEVGLALGNAAKARRDAKGKVVPLRRH